LISIFVNCSKYNYKSFCFECNYDDIFSSFICDQLIYIFKTTGWQVSILN